MSKTVDLVARARRKITRAIKEFRKKYGKASVVTGMWGIEHNGETWVCKNRKRPQVCAMAALVMVYDNVDDKTSEHEAAAKILGVPQSSVSNFISGFDHSDYFRGGKWARLGREMRELLTK